MKLFLASVLNSRYINFVKCLQMFYVVFYMYMQKFLRQKLHVKNVYM